MNVIAINNWICEICGLNSGTLEKYKEYDGTDWTQDSIFTIIN